MKVRWIVCATVACLMLGTMSVAAEKGFELKDKAGEYLDVVYQGKVVGRYMYAYDNSSPERFHETYKPYLHIFDAEGKAPITKGPGGRYTHHRGIFIGFSRLKCGDKSYDRWHMKGGAQIHQKFLAQEAGADSASFTSLVQWNDNEEKPLLVEERTMTFRKPPESAYVLVDFESTLKAVADDLILGGDPEHAGIQYRPANEVVSSKTLYVFPTEDANPKAEVDYPWVGETYTLADKQYSVIFMNRPDNPKQTKFSAYRDYGRFGAFPTIPIKKDESATVKYRIIVGEGAMPPRETIEKLHKAYVGS